MIWKANILIHAIDIMNFMKVKAKGEGERCPTIYINGSILQKAGNAKFVGLMLDDKLHLGWIYKMHFPKITIDNTIIIIST